MAQEITFEVTDLHAEMLQEARNIAGDSTVNDSAEDFIHNLYKQAKRAQEQQMQSFEIEKPEERE